MVSGRWPTPQTTWLKLPGDRSAAVGRMPPGLKRGLGQGFFVLGPLPREGGLRPIIAHGAIRKGRVVLREGMLSFRDCMALSAHAELVAHTG